MANPTRGSGFGHRLPRQQRDHEARVAILVVLGGVIVLDQLFGLSLATQLLIAVPLALLLPLLVHRHARSIWLAVGYLAGTLDERAGRKGRRAGRLPGA